MESGGPQESLWILMGPAGNVTFSNGFKDDFLNPRERGSLSDANFIGRPRTSICVVASSFFFPSLKVFWCISCLEEHFAGRNIVRLFVAMWMWEWPTRESGELGPLGFCESFLESIYNSNTYVC